MLLTSPSFSDGGHVATTCVSTTTYCKKVINSILTFEWRFETDKAFFKMTKNRKGHAVIGPGTSMSNGDVWQVEKTGVTLTLKDCHLVGDVAPDCAAETNNLTIISQTATADSFTIEFSRPLTAPESGKDKTIVADSITTFIWSYTDNDAITEHAGNERGTLKIDLSAPDGGNLVKDWWGDSLFLPHQHGLIIIWTILCDLLIIVGKNLKFINRYFDVHSFCFIILAIASWILVGMEPDDRRRRLLEETIEFNNVSHGERILASALADDDLHETFSTLLTIALIFLLIFGSILRMAIALCYKFIGFVWVDVTYQRWFHTFCGIAAWIAARGAVITGCALHELDYGPTLLIIIIVETVLALIVHCTLEIAYRVSRIKFRAALSTKSNPSEANKKIIERIRSKGNYYPL